MPLDAAEADKKMLDSGLEVAESGPEVVPEAPRRGQSDGKLEPLPRTPGKPGFGGGTICTPLELFDYWLALTPEQSKRVSAYVYRDWPKINPFQVLSEADLAAIAAHKPLPSGKPKPQKNIDILGQCPCAVATEWEEVMLHRFGAGRYHIMLNDLKGKVAVPDDNRKSGSKNLCTAWIKPTIGHEDVNPPNLNYDHLVMNDKDNESFIITCRRNGIRLPGDPPTPFELEEDEDMANTAVVEKLTDAFIAAQQQNRQQQPEPRPAAPGIDPTIAIQKVADVMANITERGFQTMTNAVDRANEAQVKQGDPIERAKELLGLAKEMQPPPAQPQPTDGLAMKFVDAMLARNERLESTVDKLIERLSTPPPPAPAAVAPAVANPATGEPMSPLRKALTELKDAKDLLDELGGGKGDDEDDESAPDKLARYTNLLQAAGPIVNSGLSSTANMVYNIAVAVMKKGTPEPPQPAVNPAANGTPALQPGPKPAAQQPAQQQPLELDSFIRAVEPELLFQLRAGGNGSLFAASLLQRGGKPVQDLYTQMVALGGQAIEQWIYGNLAIGQQLSQIPERFSQFMNQFLDVQAVSSILSGEPVRQKVKVSKPRPTAPAPPDAPDAPPAQ